ncbi:cytochrome b5 domain-containing protein [Patescibacteria group bacterium]
MSKKMLFFLLFPILIVFTLSGCQQKQPAISNKAVTTKVNEKDNQELKRTFTSKELSGFNGLDSNEAYVAVDGLVYDLTSVFENGKHYGYFAGKDLTDEFYAKHEKNKIEKYPVIGKLSL